MKRYVSVRNRDLTKICWIIDQGFRIVHVKARYFASRSRWSYKKLDGSGSSSLTPYQLHVLGNKSYWGDGDHYTTRKSALKDQRHYINMAIKALKQKMPKDMATAIRDLKDLREEMNIRKILEFSLKGGSCG